MKPCQDCGTLIFYSGIGRPTARCDDCEVLHHAEQVANDQAIRELRDLAEPARMKRRRERQRAYTIKWRAKA